MKKEANHESRQTSRETQIHPGAPTSAVTTEGGGTTETNPRVVSETLAGVVEGWRIWRIKDGQLHSPAAKGPIWNAHQAKVSEHRRRPKAVLSILAFAASGYLVPIFATSSVWLTTITLFASFALSVIVLGVVIDMWRDWWFVSPCEAPCITPLGTFGCGLYAWKSFEQVSANDIVVNPRRDGSYYVLGRVALWGEVVEYEHGYAGQYAYPLSFEFVFDHGSKEWIGLEHLSRKALDTLNRYVELDAR